MNFTSTIKETAALLSAIDYEKLPISDYNKQYIRRLKPAFAYFLSIYAYCIKKGLKDIDIPLSDITIVDFGGGCGFLSIFAKKLCIGKVIYVDLNPLSVDTITLLKEKTGLGPDMILHGTSDVLAATCSEKQIVPNLLIATDLIEHVYNLNTFFDELTGINRQMRMLFTTASNPYNPYVKRKLYRMMQACECGNAETPNYYTKRMAYIKQHFTILSEQGVKEWTLRTRGLVYADINYAIENSLHPKPLGPYNTCDPETGNWTERILSIESYRNILLKHGYRLSVHKGFYNEQRPQKWKTIACQCINQLIRFSGKAGFLLSPFIVLYCEGEEKRTIAG